MHVETLHSTRLVFRLLARLFPFRPPPGWEHTTAAELGPRFKGWDTRIVLILFAWAPFTVWGSKALLARSFPPPVAPVGAQFHLTIDPMFYLLPGLFLGLVLAALPAMGIVRLWLGERFSEYILYCNLLVGFDTVRIWYATASALAVLAVALALAASGVHLTVFADHLEWSHFGQMKPVSAPASRVTSAAADERGALTLGFADGSTWSSAGDLGLLSPTAEQARAIALRYQAGRKP